MLSTEHFKNSALIVGTEMSDAKLRPLQMFRGRMDMSTIRSRVGLLLAMMEAEVQTRAEVCKHSVNFPDDGHFIGQHHPLQSMSLAMFVSRIYCVPEMISKINPHLREYLDWFVDLNRLPLFQLNKISSEAFRTHWDWRLIARTPKEREQKTVAEYPFIRSAPTDEHAMLMTVHNAVPKHIAPEIRADLCQDLIVAVLSGEIALGNVADEWRNYLKSCRKKYCDRWGTISLDYPQGVSDRPLKDLIAGG